MSGLSNLILVGAGAVALFGAMGHAAIRIYRWCRTLMLLVKSMHRVVQAVDRELPSVHRALTELRSEVEDIRRTIAGGPPDG